MEAKPPSAFDLLNNSQRAFLIEYLACGLNATEAARRLHYDHPRVTGWRFVTNVAFKAALLEALEEGKMSRAEVLQRISDKTVADMSYFLRIDKEENCTLDLHKARKNGKLHLIKKLKFKNGKIDSIELHDPKPYLELLAKHHEIIKPKEEENAEGKEIHLEWEDARPTE